MIDLTLSKKMKSQYSLGYPFPHIVIDEFLPEFLLELLSEFLPELFDNDLIFSSKLIF